MTSGSASGDRPELANGQQGEKANGQRAEISADQIAAEQLPERVAELASELTETDSRPLRQRLARQIPQLASRSGQATWRGLQSGRDAAARGLRSSRAVPGRGAQRSEAADQDVLGTGQAGKRGKQVGRGGAQAGRRGIQAGRRAIQAGRRGIQAGSSAARRRLQVSGQWLTAQTLEMAPRVSIRSIATLRAQYPGYGTEALADVLIKNAARASAGVGAAMGVAAATPFIPTMPVELGVETLALVGIELKLTAELHEVYGMRAPGSAPERMMAYLGAWANRRGIRITSSGVALAMGSPLRRKLERRLVAKAGQSTLSLAPLLAGAVAGALIDHRETHRLGTQVRNDLQKRSPQAPAITA
jgi:hypothetical protein